MTNKNKILKTLLRTSALAAALVSVDAMAAGVRNVGGAAVNLDVIGAYVAGDSIAYNDIAGIVTFNVANRVIPGISINNAIAPAAASLIAASTTIGAIGSGDVAGAAGGSLNLDFNADAILTLTGAAGGAAFGAPIAANAVGTYGKLGAIDMKNRASTTIVSATGVTLAGQIFSTAANGVVGKGTFTVSGANNTFSGQLSAVGDVNAIGLLNITAGAGDTTFSNANLGTIGALTVSGASTAKFTAAGLKVLTGDVTTTGGGKLSVTGPLTINAGNAVIGTSGAEVTGVTTITAGNLTTAAGTASVFTGNLLLNGAGSSATFGAAATLGGNLTVGTGGLLGAGVLTFGNAAPFIRATTTIANPLKAGIVNSTMTINTTGTATTISAPITTFDATSKLAFTNAGAIAKVTTNIGATGAATTFAQIKLGAANDTVELSTDVKAFTTEFNLADATATLRLAAGSAVIGTITPNAAANGTVKVFGNTGGQTTKMGANQLGTLRFESVANGAAADSTFTFGQQNANGTITKIATLAFDGAAADKAGIVIDMKDVAFANTTSLQLNATTFGVVQTGLAGTGTIKFTNNALKAPVKVTANALLGTYDGHMQSIDAGEATTLTLEGKMHVGSIQATEVVFTAVATELGVYGAGATKYTINGGGAQIYTKSVMGTREQPLSLNFKTDHAIVLADLVDMYVNTTIDETVGSGFGQITLQGDNKLYLGTAGTDPKKLNSINIAAVANKTVSLLSLGSKTTDFYGDVEFIAGSTATTTTNINFNVHGDVVRNGGGVVGIVNLQGITIDGSLGSGALASVTAATKVQVDTIETTTIGAATAASTYTANATHFLQNGTLLLTKNVSAGTVLGAVTTATNNTGSIVVYNDVDMAASAVGEVGKALKSFEIRNDKTFTAASALNITNLTTDTDLKSKVVINGASDSKVTNIGTKDLRFSTVTMNSGGNTATFANIYADSIVVTDGTLAAKRFDTTNAIGTKLTAGTSNAKVLDGGYIGVVTGAVGSDVIVDGSATMGGDLAAGINLTLYGDNTKVVKFSGASIGGNLVQGASTLNFTKAATVDGTSAFTASTVNLGDKLTLTGAAHLAGALKLGFVYDTANAGIITVANAPTVAVGTTLTLVRPAGTAMPDAGSTTKVFVKADGSAIDSGALVANIANTAFRAGVWDSKTSSITWTGRGRSSNFVTASVLAKNRNAAKFAELQVANSNSKILDAVDKELLSKIEELSSISIEKTTAMIEKLTDVSGLDAIANLSQASTVAFAAVATQRAPALVSGVSGGDEASKFGVWGQATIGSADQKLRKGVSGFKSKMFGAVVGVDTMLSDSASLGVMVGDSASNIKFKDIKAGDKLKANTWLFGAYGGYEFANNFFVQANAAVAQTTARAKDGRITSEGQVTASSKYDVMNYAAEVRGGYRYQFENSSVTPTVGLRYNYAGDTSYAETGAGVQNRKISGKATSTISALAGVKLGTAIDINGSSVIPEVHMNVDYALSKSAPKAGIKLGSTSNFDYKGEKQAKFGYNFGASVMTQNDNVEYGVGYDANIADKYLGHQGSVKVRLAF